MDPKVFIREFIQKLLRDKGDTASVSDTASLFASGRLASIDALQLVVMLENTYGLDFSEGFDRDQLDTVVNIMDLIATK
jgi:acyl carrier protein